MGTKRVLMLMAVIALLATDAAIGQVYEPARLISLRGAEHLDCPTSGGASQIYFCHGTVSAAGTAESAQCFATVNDVSYGRVLARRVIGSEFSPARIDGERVPVHVTFRVLFEDNDEDCTASIFPNFGYQQDEFGLDYIDAQAILNTGDWPVRGPNDSQGWHALKGIAFAVTVHVDTFGNASDGDIEVINIQDEDFVRRYLEAMESMRFIPAFVDGAPHASRNFEVRFVECASGLARGRGFC